MFVSEVGTVTRHFRRQAHVRPQPAQMDDSGADALAKWKKTRGSIDPRNFDLASPGSNAS